MAVNLEKKVNTSISVRESTLEQLKEHLMMYLMELNMTNSKSK